VVGSWGRISAAGESLLVPLAVLAVAIDPRNGKAPAGRLQRWTGTEYQPTKGQQ
jgi:hypothetical protein